MTKENITSAVIKFHATAEQMAKEANYAEANPRIVFSLEESRKLRDLLSDAEVLISRSERILLEIPIKLKVAVK